MLKLFSSIALIEVYFQDKDGKDKNLMQKDFI